MSANVKVTILGIVVLGISGILFYMYWNSPSFVLYKEAVELYEDGKLKPAFDKASEALKVDNKNRRALKLRSDIHFELRSENDFNNAKTFFKTAETSFNLGNYVKAEEYYIKTLDSISNIGRRAKNYTEAQQLVDVVHEREKALNERLAAYYYNIAMGYYKRGELRKALFNLNRTPVATEQIILLKGDIAYSIGYKRYTEIKSKPSMPVTYYNDAIYWLEQVPPSSSYYQNSRLMIDGMKKIID